MHAFSSLKWGALRRAIQTALCCALLCGCSQQAPSVADGRACLQNKIKDQAQGRIRLIRFKKTDGQKLQMFGTDIYQLKYEADIQFTEDCSWGPFDFNGWSGNFYTVAGKPEGGLDSFSPAFMGKRQAAKGSTQSVASVLTFVKSEKGWHVQE